MKRPRSYDDDLEVTGEKGISRDWGGRDHDFDRSSSHRRFHSKTENGWKKSSSSSHDRSYDDDREAARASRKRLDRDLEAFDRRKGYDRFRDCTTDRTNQLSSPRSIYSNERIHRSESFSRRDFSKGFRSDRDNRVSSWHRRSNYRDFDEETRVSVEASRGQRVLTEDRVGIRSLPKVLSEDRGSAKSPTRIFPEDRRNTRSPTKFLRDDKGTAKSPSRVLPEEEICPRSPAEILLEDRESVRASQMISDISNSDFRAEISKSTEIKEKDAIHDGGSTSEMEEGELEPENESEAKMLDITLSQVFLEREAKCSTDSEKSESQLNALNIDKLVEHQAISDEKQDVDSTTDTDREVNEMLTTQENMEVDEVKRDEGEMQEKECQARDENDEDKNDTQDDGEKKEICVEESTCQSEPSLELNSESSDKFIEDLSLHNLAPSEDVNKNSIEIDVETKTERNLSAHVHKETIETNAFAEEAVNSMIDKLNLDGKDQKLQLNETAQESLSFIDEKQDVNVRDKHKKTLSAPLIETNSLTENRWVEDSTGANRGSLDLFLHSDVSKPQTITENNGKHKHEKLKLEPLELSLGLPSYGFTDPSMDHNTSYKSSDLARSVRSLPNTFHNFSDDPSVTFLGSPQLVHIPNCSFTQNSSENDQQSVRSHPIFLGTHQMDTNNYQEKLSGEVKHNGASLYQEMLLKGNSALQVPKSSKSSVRTTSHGQSNPKLTEGSSGELEGLHRCPRQLSRKTNPTEARTKSLSVDSLETMDKTWARNGNGHSHFQAVQIDADQLVEKFIFKLVSEPLEVMTWKFQEMPESSLALLREGVREMIVNESKRHKLHVLQKTLVGRCELSSEALQKCPEVQLEILVALKTGLQYYLLRDKRIPSSDLVDIFLNLKCKNLACRSFLPVNECACKVCSKRNGFCSSCMCLVCSKFDMAFDTCSWVGCDVCLHWCHADCGLQDSHIRNGPKASGPPDITEMQFYCVACGHPSEMFGFVRDVFKACANSWNSETLYKELKYVKRIFSSSNDVRGKQLWDMANQMLNELEKSSEPTEVYQYIIKFLDENVSSFCNAPSNLIVKELSQKNPAEECNGTIGSILEPIWMTSQVIDQSSSLEKSKTGGSSLMDCNLVGRQIEEQYQQPNLERQIEEQEQQPNLGRQIEEQEQQPHLKKKPAADELESIVRIKQAEAKMFQNRADEARNKAEGLKRLAMEKNEKIEEEYAQQVAKLQIVEAEGRRKQKHLEFQIIERAQCDYLKMKSRVESDIKDLLVKLEVMRRKLSS